MGCGKCSNRICRWSCLGVNPRPPFEFRPSRLQDDQRHIRLDPYTSGRLHDQPIAVAATEHLLVFALLLLFARGRNRLAHVDPAIRILLLLFRRFENLRRVPKK